MYVDNAPWVYTVYSVLYARLMMTCHDNFTSTQEGIIKSRRLYFRKSTNNNVV